MRVNAVLLSLILFILSGCSSYEASIDDVKTTRYLAFPPALLGDGSVFVMTESDIKKVYPDDEEKKSKNIAVSRLRELGYDIAGSAETSTATLMLIWGIKGAGISGYDVSGDSVVPRNAIVHSVEGTLIKTKDDGNPGETLWTGSVSETWGHASVDHPRMTSLLMRKFPD